MPAQSNTNNLDWINILVVLGVGLAQAIVLYITVKEMRRGREALVTPFLTLKAAGDRMNAYTFKVKNEGTGLAIKVSLCLNNMFRASNVLDLLPSKEEKSIQVNLSGDPKWLSQTEHLVHLRFSDIYNHEFLATFIVKSSDSQTDRLPIRNTLQFRGVTQTK